MLLNLIALTLGCLVSFLTHSPLLAVITTASIILICHRDPDDLRPA